MGAEVGREQRTKRWGKACGDADQALPFPLMSLVVFRGRVVPELLVRYRPNLNFKLLYA